MIERYSRSNGKYYPANTRVFNNIMVAGTGARVIDLGVAALSAAEENLASHRFDNNLYLMVIRFMQRRGLLLLMSALC